MGLDLLGCRDAGGMTGNQATKRRGCDCSPFIVFCIRVICFASVFRRRNCAED